jgi:hypothetical protein
LSDTGTSVSALTSTPARRLTTERILFYTGINHKIGEVHDGAATMDWMAAGAGAWHHHHLRRGHHLLLEGHGSSIVPSIASTSSIRPVT